MWAVDATGQCPARKDFYRLPEKDRAKFFERFKLLAQHGKINNKELFRKLSPRNLWEFKKYQTRLIGDFRPGKRFLVAHCVKGKKTDKIAPRELDKAERILQENDAVESRLENEATH